MHPLFYSCLWLRSRRTFRHVLRRSLLIAKVGSGGPLNNSGHHQRQNDLREEQPSLQSFGQTQQMVDRRLEVRVGGRAEYVRGIITDAHVDGSVDIEFEIGSRKMFAPRSLIEFL